MDIDKLVATLLCLAALCFPPAARADDKFPVGVTVTVAVAPLIHALDETGQQAIRKAAAAAVAERLAATLTYWDFQPAADGSPSPPYRLAVTVVDPDPMDNVLQASLTWRLVAGNQPLPVQEHPWLEPIDFAMHRYPPADLLAAAIGDRFHAFFLAGTDTTLADTLQHRVPIAGGGAWLTPAEGQQVLRLVLALPYDTFAPLGYAVFLVRARRPGVLPRDFTAQGIGLALPYPPAAPSPLFQGLAAQPLVDQGTNELTPDLHLGPIFLQRLEASDFFIP